MRLVLGGVAQGKRNYVKTAYHISENDIFSGENAELQQLCGAKAVDKFHLWVRRKVKEQADVPKLTEREYREQVGRMQVILAKSSESVERVICGIAQKIK